MSGPYTGSMVPSEPSRDPASEPPLEVWRRLAQDAADAELLGLSGDGAPQVEGRGEVALAFGGDLAEAWVSLASEGGKPAALAAWGAAEAAEAFALGAGLPFRDWSGALSGRGALALGFRDQAPLSPSIGSCLLRLEGAPEEDPLALGARARASLAWPLAPADPAGARAWAQRRDRGLEAELGSEPAWGLAVVAEEGGDAAAAALEALGWRVRAVGRLTAAASLPGVAGAPSEPGIPESPAPDLPGDPGAGGLEAAFLDLLRTSGPLGLPEAARFDLGEAGTLVLRPSALPHLADLDAFWGAAGTAAEAAQGLACVGAGTLGVALALPESAKAQSLLGLRQACASLDLPILGLRRMAGLPAPLAVALGWAEAGAGPVDVDAPEARGLAGSAPRIAGVAYRKALDGLFLLGSPREELGGSAYLARRGGADACPEPWLDELFRLQACLREGVRLGLFRSARPVGRGGLLAAALEGSRRSGLGCQLFLEPRGGRLDALAFGETPGRALVTTSGEGESALRTLARTHRLPLVKVGVVGGDRFAVAVAGEPCFDAGLGELDAGEADRAGVPTIRTEISARGAELFRGS